MATDDHVAALIRLGLTGYEARAYLALVRADSLTGAEVARAAELPRQRIYDVLDALRERGLATVERSRGVRYTATAPGVAIDRLIGARREAVAQLERDAGQLATDLTPIFEEARAKRDPGCAAVILAAGSASRFGSAKLIAPLDGRPLLQHVLDLAAEARLQPVVVVLGAESMKLRDACSWRGEQVMVNPDPAAGLSGSVKLGLAQLSLSPAPRALVLLGDQPRLRAGQLRTILAAPADESRPIVVPRYDGKPGNPVMLERAAWPLATGLTGDSGMAQLFAANHGLLRYVDVNGANPDVDTPADLAALESAAEG